jgi:hypothetical protein
MVDIKQMLCICGSRNLPIKSSKELSSQISQAACLCLVSCQWMLWSADHGCAS